MMMNDKIAKMRISRIVALKTFLPFLEWVGDYRLAKMKRDALAGITVALILIPQSMAYAQLAGLPAYFGLYASFLPPLVAALLGSSRQLATGPVAVVSIMTAAALEPLAIAGSDNYIAYAVLLALMVGVFQLALGTLRLGLLVNFLSHPVINGFSNAAAIIIASSQLSKIFGVNVDKGLHHHETVLNVIRAAIDHTHWPTFGMCLLAFAIIYGLKRIAPRLPGILIAVVLTTLLSWILEFERNIRVDIKKIADPEATGRILTFNDTANAIISLVKQRTELKQKLEHSGTESDPVTRIGIRHDIAVINHRIKDLKNSLRRVRAELRDLRFAGIPDMDGSLKFIPTGQISKRRKKTGNIWRMIIGDDPLPARNMLFCSGGEVVGSIPIGLPGLTMPRIETGGILNLLPFAAIISLLGFMEAISIARAMAARTGQRIDPNQELIGQGLANICGAFFKSYPTSGSFSRSAVNLQVGACTGFSGLFTSATVVLALLFFTPLLFYLPQSVLAAVIMAAVVGLINIKGFVHAWRSQWYDGAISIITFIFTLAYAPHLERGILVGVSLSLLVFLYKNMRPTVVDLSLGIDKAMHDAVAFGLKECRYIDVVRFDGPLFFANASYLEDQINQRRRSNQELKHIIIVANGINDMDASGEESLSLIIDRVRSAGIDISISGVNEAVMQVLKRTHLLAKIGEDHIYARMETAINTIYELTHKDGQEKNCPLKTVVFASPSKEQGA